MQNSPNARSANNRCEERSEQVVGARTQTRRAVRAARRKPVSAHCATVTNAQKQLNAPRAHDQAQGNQLPSPNAPLGIGSIAPYSPGEVWWLPVADCARAYCDSHKCAAFQVGCFQQFPLFQYTSINCVHRVLRLEPLAQANNGRLDRAACKRRP